MIYFYYGQDKAALYKKASKLFESLRTKKPDASFITFDADNFSLSTLEELTGSQGLFEKKIVALIRNVISEGNKDFEKSVISKVSDAAKSENIVIWIESDLSKEALSSFKKNAEKSDIEEEKKEKKKSEDNVFALAEAFGRRDKKTLWTLFLKAIEKSEAEAIHGMLFWQIKAIALAHTAKTAAEADLNPFVFGKAKTFTKNYSESEIKKISSDFVKMYHDAHRGMGELSVALEKFILSL